MVYLTMQTNICRVAATIVWATGQLNFPEGMKHLSTYSSKQDHFKDIFSDWSNV